MAGSTHEISPARRQKILYFIEDAIPADPDNCPPDLDGIPTEYHEDTLNVLWELIWQGHHLKNDKLLPRALRRLAKKLAWTINTIPDDVFREGIHGTKAVVEGGTTFLYSGTLRESSVSLKGFRVQHPISGALLHELHSQAFLWMGMEHTHVLMFYGFTILLDCSCVVWPWRDHGNVV